ncbi:MAG: hypothetical protein IH591_19865, partial [Bacteroidales bacterium]|nr:hypothetical protein [Bacteroidales bacterium]
NIFYHLGLAYYLDGDLEDALEAWQRDLSLAVNDDMKVATMHWVYMTLREMHRDTEAYAVLTDITPEMNIIENQAYHKLCLFYKGEISFDEVLGSDQGVVMNDALLYGIGNWFLYNDNDQTRALEYFNRIFGAGSWASFGYIAAEVKSARF